MDFTWIGFSSFACSQKWDWFQLWLNKIAHYFPNQRLSYTQQAAPPKYRCTEFAGLSCPDLSPLLRKPNCHTCLGSNSVFYSKNKPTKNPTQQHFSLPSDHHLKPAKLLSATVCKYCSSSTFSVLLYDTGRAASGGDSIILQIFRDHLRVSRIGKDWQKEGGKQLHKVATESKADLCSKWFPCRFCLCRDATSSEEAFVALVSEG